MSDETDSGATSSVHERHLREALGAVRRRWWRLNSLAVLARVAAGVAVILLAAAGVELLARPTPPALVGLGLWVIGLSAALFVWFGWRLRRRPSDRQIARFVEERCPELEDRVASAAQIAFERSGTRFRDLVLADATRRLREIDPERIVSRRSLRSALWQTTGAAAVLVAGLFVVAGPAGRAARALTWYLLPTTLEIEVIPGDAKVVIGQSLRVRARVLGASAFPGPVVPELVVSSGEQQQPAAMRAEGDAFALAIDAVTSSFTYRVTAADASSRDFNVTAIRAPRVEQIDVEYRYPAFTGLKPRIEQDSGDVYAPVGTRVRLRVKADKLVETGALVMADGKTVDLRGAEPDVLEAGFTIAEDGSYRVALTDVDGLSSPGDTEYFIRTMDDRPPDVRILRPGGDRPVTRLEEVAIEARADDDHGIERFELVYAVRGGDEKVVPLRANPAAPTSTGNHVLAVEDLDVRPGDFITYYARARDVSRAKRSTEARSDIFFLEVKPFDEEFVAAQSQSMAGSGNRSLDDLATAQKEIIIATWKLDRRSTGGRSDQDIKAVAKAQGELKVRAQEVAGQLRSAMRDPRRRPRPGQAQTGGTVEDDPMIKAVEAMGQAEASLDAARTREALPHEMEALNQLLRAQADVRRRQVARQASSGGGGGSNRANQDLSSLFDRELQRQQETNYETRSSLEGREETPESDALNKVRALARRQDELSQQQRDLAKQQAQMNPEELKRQLERLTREQTELRRQAEELSRQLSQQQQQQAQQQQQSGRSQSQAGRSGGQPTGSRLRDITEDMQGAASDLRRQNLEQASARSGRAADQLRDLGRQLERSQPDERRRAVAELQLEARQMADAQRRMAAEAGRAGSGKTGADSLRRLAGEQDRLAERAERLERSAKELASTGNGDDRQRLSQAVREMDRQQLGERMRDAASKLREAGSQETGGERAGETARLARTEEDLARGLDRVAERLGAADGRQDAESRRLSDQLEAARSARDALAEIERQIESLARGAEQPRPGQAPNEASRNGGEQRAGQPSSEGREGEQGSRDGTGGSAQAELARLRAEYDRQLRKTQEIVEELRRQNPSLGPGGTPEHHEFSTSAPGTEAFKQDYAKWDILRQGVNLAIERLEVTLSQKLYERLTKDRLNAGADERAPEAYRKAIEKYYQSLAAKKGDKP